MANPIIYTFPAKRPNFFTAANWSGSPGDQHPVLNVSYVDFDGSNGVLALTTRNHVTGFMCLPTTATINDLSEDLLVAHVRMAGMISGTIPGSQEYSAALMTTSVNNDRNFQTPIGDVKVIGVEAISDTIMRLEFQKGSAASRMIDIPLSDLVKYTWAPGTQLLTVAGAIKVQFPTYVQDPATNKFLTQVQMDNIAAHVLTLEPWL